MRIRHYLVDRIKGPNDGAVTLTAIDLFSKIEARKALAPHVSIGSLTGAITGLPGTFAVTTDTGNLTPGGRGVSTITGGVGGWVSVGAKEILRSRAPQTPSRW